MRERTHCLASCPSDHCLCFAACFSHPCHRFISIPMSSVAKALLSVLIPSLLFYFFLNPKTLHSSANCSKLHPFDAARKTSPRPDPSPRHDYGDLDARSTASFSKTKEWGDPSRFHPGCRSKGSQLHGSEHRRENGGGTTTTPLDGGAVPYGNGDELVIGVHRFGLGSLFRLLFVGSHVLGLSFYLMCFIKFVPIAALSVITSNRVPVGGSGLCASLCTLCAYFALGRRRVSCICKWSLPLSSRVKLSVTRCSVQWHHDGKDVRMVVMLCCSRVADQVIFPLCHRCVKAVKANRVASRALFAS